MVINVGAILAGVGLMVGGSYLVVHGASAIATRFGVPELVIGATILALATSLPELTTVVVAAAQGKHDMGLGNIVGSNILNVLAILGVALLILPMDVPAKVNLETTAFLLIATGYLLYCLLFRKQLTRIDGLVLVACFVTFTLLSYRK